MKDMSQKYQSLLKKEIDSLERDRRKEYEYLFDDLARKGMIRADLHIEQVLELEKKVIQYFTEYATGEYIKLKDFSGADIDNINMLEIIYRQEINTIFGRSLQRIAGIISNVRGSISIDFAQEYLERVKSDAFQALEIAKIS